MFKSDSINSVVNERLCIGCGFCTISCPENAIVMRWTEDCIWSPKTDSTSCNHCGSCYRICPQTPENIAKYAVHAAEYGERFGLKKDYDYFISYDQNKENRIRSASGGTLTAVLQYILATGLVDGIIGSVPLTGKVGEPHYQLQVLSTPEDLDRARSSHYHPLCYDRVFSEIIDTQRRYALVGVPCVIRGVNALSLKLREKISFALAPVCGHNVTGRFIDCLAGQEGIGPTESFGVNLRDKLGGIRDANNYNNVFVLADRTIRRNRFETCFTHMWRNYYFAQPCCLYCPDFYGADADLSVKDGSGRLSTDPLGTSLLVVRNPELASVLEELERTGRLYLEQCDEEEIFRSQVATPIFKHLEVRDRLVWKKSLRNELTKREYLLGTKLRWWHRSSWGYFRLKLLGDLSELFYSHLGHVSITAMVFVAGTYKVIIRFLQRCVSATGRSAIYALKVGARLVGLQKQRRPINKQRLKVLISGGYGYGNIGDEAQLAANLGHWRKVVPDGQLTVLTPNPQHTQKNHAGVQTELAPRISLFGWGDRQYFGSDIRFKRMYFFLAILYLSNACLVGAGLPVIGLTARQARMLAAINSSDILFLSGGGYLTGMTLTRLWDNMLLIRLAYSLGVPVVLSGQTIGVLEDRVSRFLARWGLKKAELIYLRDHADSLKTLALLGIPKEKVKSTFDDALFYDGASKETVADFLSKNSIDPTRPYLAVNVHFWGQAPAQSKTIMEQIASALDRIQVDLGLQIVFVPMHSSDEAAIREVIHLMQTSGHSPDHGYEPGLAVGLIHNSTLCLTMKHHPIIFAMAAGVPTISMAFDPYYYHKNSGAQEIFRQERFVIYCAPEKLSQSIEESVTESYNRRDSLSSEIKARVEELRPMAGEVIYRWLDKAPQPGQV